MAKIHSYLNTWLPSLKTARKNKLQSLFHYLTSRPVTYVTTGADTGFSEGGGGGGDSHKGGVQAPLGCSHRHFIGIGIEVYSPPPGILSAPLLTIPGYGAGGVGV